MGLYPLVFMGFPVLSWLGARGEGQVVIWSALVGLLVLKAWLVVDSFSFAFLE